MLELFAFHFVACAETIEDDPITRILLFGYLIIKVWDRDVGNPDDFLGQVVLPFSSFPLCPHDVRKTSDEVFANFLSPGGRKFGGEMVPFVTATLKRRKQRRN